MKLLTAASSSLKHAGLVRQALAFLSSSLRLVVLVRKALAPLSRYSLRTRMRLYSYEQTHGWTKRNTSGVERGEGWVAGKNWVGFPML